MKKTFILMAGLAIMFLSGCVNSSGISGTSNSITPKNMEGSSWGGTNGDYGDDYDDGYSWAEENDIDNFDDCQDEFGAGEGEDGCNDYVKENYTGSQSFHGYECTEDCGGHQAGYDWAENNGIEYIDDCGGTSQSFIEGCHAYVEDN